jgi:hypothetical protein
MDEGAARALKNIVTDKGRQVLRNARQCEALLQDHSPSTRRENSALMEALKADIPKRLLALPSGSLSQATLANLATTLANETALSTEAAQWAVCSWAAALDLPIVKIEPRVAPPAPAPATAPDVPLQNLYWEAAPPWATKEAPKLSPAPRDPEKVAETVGKVVGEGVCVVVTAAAALVTAFVLFWSCKYLPSCSTTANGFAYWGTFFLIIIFVVVRYVWWSLHHKKY